MASSPFSALIVTPPGLDTSTPPVTDGEQGGLLEAVSLIPDPIMRSSNSKHRYFCRAITPGTQHAVQPACSTVLRRRCVPLRVTIPAPPGRSPRRLRGGCRRRVPRCPSRWRRRRAGTDAGRRGGRVRRVAGGCDPRRTVGAAGRWRGCARRHEVGLRAPTVVAGVLIRSAAVLAEDLCQRARVRSGSGSWPAIAKILGVSVGTLYNHIPDRKELRNSRVSRQLEGSK
jgi:hypothetical protein